MAPSTRKWQCRDRVLDLATPGGHGRAQCHARFLFGRRTFRRRADRRCAHARRMIGEGAAIIDIGGESTRPGASPADRGAGARARDPDHRALRRESGVFISVDTSKPEVMRAAVAAGADIINDVRALPEPGALEAAAASGAGICLMHMQGEPRTMQDAPQYEDVVADVSGFLAARVRACRDAGIDAARLAHRSGFRIRQTRRGQPGLAQESREPGSARHADRGGPVTQVDACDTHRPRVSRIGWPEASRWPPLRFSTERVSCAPTTWPPPWMRCASRPR